jgi:hypothetical protein
MEERENTIALVIFALIAALCGYGMYWHASKVDAMLEQQYEEMKARKAAEREFFGAAEQEEFEDLLLLIPSPDEEFPPAVYVDREVQDWVDEHPFYEWGELV